MFTIIIYFLLFIFMLVSSNFAETPVPGGYASGTWEAANSPYLIQGDITIHTDSTLVIEPGVEVVFQGLYTFQINGSLTAIGTEIDSIFFSAADTSIGWGGIRLAETANMSSISYARICYGRNTDGGGIYCASPNAEITHCAITNNNASNNGGGICINTGLTNPPPVINNCVISRNSARYGGGVFYVADSMDISNCVISNNSASHTSGEANGGGLYFDGGFSSGVSVNNCIIQNNYCEADSNVGTSDFGLGGGLYIHGRNNRGTFISNSQIVRNWSRRSGGGIFVRLGGVVITDCIIKGNFTKHCAAGPNFVLGAGAISFDVMSVNSIISRCEISENSGMGYAGGAIRAYNRVNASLILENCTISKNYSWIGSGAIYFAGVVNLKNSIVALNQSQNDAGGIYVNGINVSFCDFFSNDGSDIIGAPGGFGTLTATNANGDSCDVYSNIFLDPLFADTANSDYQITWSNWPNIDFTRSPAIDAGDPTFPYDPDSTIIDIGALYFNQLETENLIINPGCEYTLVDGEIPHWTEVIGSNWTQRTAGPEPHEGLAYFFPGVAALAELQQDVDVSAYKSSIDAETKSFMFEGYVRAYPQTPADQSRIILEFLDSLKTTKIDSFDSGNYSNTTEWVQITDTSVAPSGTRYIRIRLISTRRAGSNNDGYFDDLSLLATDVTAIEEIKHNIPESLILFQNYPNPFNPITKIKFTLLRAEKVKVDVYNIIGQKIETLLNKPMPAGYHEVEFNGQDLSSGVYMYRIEAGNWHDVKKMILLR